MQHTAEQQLAIESLSRRICVDAGAGSGKTRVLIDRIVHLIDKAGVPLDEIVAITFTDKAAGEMKHRLRQKFREKARDALEDPQELSRWRELERQVEYARISTIHSFCTGILRENALRLGMHPDFGVLTDADAVLMRQEVVTETLLQLAEVSDSSLFLVATTYSAYEAEKLMHMLLNKRGLLHRIAAQPQWQGCEDPGALQQAWALALETERDRCLCSLAHSPELLYFLQQLQRFEQKCVNRSDPREAQRLDSIRQLECLKAASDARTALKALETIPLSAMGRGSKKNWECDEIYEDLVNTLKKLKEWVEKCLRVDDVDPEQEAACAALTCAAYQVFRHVDHAYAARKQGMGAYDFDDLIELSVRALEQHPDIRGRVAESIRFLLVDEFQDTDGVQAQMVRTLYQHEKGPAVFVVGDAKQSIYYFRGAEVEVFSETRRESEPVIQLKKNFRSLPDVLEFVNHFFSESCLLDHCGTYPAMEVHRDPLHTPRVEFLLGETTAEGEKLNAEEKRRLEADLIASRIREMCDSGEPLLIAGEDAPRPANCGDIALLFRALENVYLYEEAFRRAGVPYVIVQGRGFYEVQEVIDVLNLLKVVVDAQDGAALLAFLRGPLACVSDDALYWLAKSHPQGLVAAFQSDTLPKLDVEKIQAARQLVEEARSRTESPLPAFLQWLLDKTALEAVLLTQFHGVQKVSNVRKLVELAANFAQQRPPSLYAFVQYLEEVRGQGVREGEAAVQAGGEGAVTIMSIHQSKGLEFPVVFVPDMGRTQRPRFDGPLVMHRNLGMAMRGIQDNGETCDPRMYTAIKRRRDEEEQAESARLLYVALTRAKDYLVLCGNCGGGARSWMESFNLAYSLEDLMDGAEIKGLRWRARVVRSSTPPLALAKTEQESQKPLEGYVQQTGALPPPPKEVWPISRLLDALTKAKDSPEETTHEERKSAPEHDAGDGAALARGTVVHRLFELWDFQQDLPDVEMVLDEARFGLAERPRMRENLLELCKNFQHHPAFPLLAAAKTLEKEVPFLWNLEGKLISGVIDAVVDGEVLIDYKTGKRNEQLTERYRLQLQLYALAARALTGTMPRRGVLVFVDASALEEPEFTHEELDQLEQRVREELSDRVSPQKQDKQVPALTGA